MPDPVRLDPTPTVPWTLHAAFWLVLAESTVEGAFVVGRDDWGRHRQGADPARLRR